jgi:3-deoxy-D-manno-octulosonic-acid transferase
MAWRLFYTVVVVPILWTMFRLLGLVDKKAARAIRGRERLFERLSAQIAGLPPQAKRVWFHSSSLGEFEQAKPIIAELKHRHPELQVVVSFFSPSGYEHSQSYKLASLITYIPFDSAANAKRFVAIMNPAAAVIVRYDIWPNHIWALEEAKVPTLIASATLRSGGARSLPILRQFHRTLYDGINYILTVSPEDKAAFDSFHLTHPVIKVVGDTRYDQVWQRSRESKSRQLIAPELLAGKRVLVVGSSWKEDEEVLLPACRQLFSTHPEFLVLLVPHEPTVENLERIESGLNGSATSIRFSNLHDYHGEKIILIDSIGILMPLYRYAHLAFVGGSFRGGVHNVLEPASYGIPVLFGPNHENSREAVDMVQLGAALPSADTETLRAQLENLLDDEPLRAAVGAKALSIVQRNMGATERFLSYLEEVL